MTSTRVARMKRRRQLRVLLHRGQFVGLERLVWAAPDVPAGFLAELLMLLAPCEQSQENVSAFFVMKGD